MSAKYKLSGFSTALLIGVISFFVIFLFFPDFSDKYIGTSFRAERGVSKTEKKTDGNAENASNGTETIVNNPSLVEEITKKFEDASGKVTEAVKEKLEEASENVNVKKLLGD